MKADRRQFLAGKPKTPSGAGSLDDWEEDLKHIDDEDMSPVDLETEEHGDDDYEDVTETDEEVMETPIQRLPLIPPRAPLLPVGSR